MTDQPNPTTPDDRLQTRRSPGPRTTPRTPTTPTPGSGSTSGSAGSAGASAGTTATAILESIRDAVDDLAERASPTVREFSARAAEFAADAADKAGPVREARRRRDGRCQRQTRLQVAKLGSGRPCLARDARRRCAGCGLAAPRPLMPAPARRTARPRPERETYTPVMSVRPIVLLGDPRLRLKGKPVDSFGKYLHELLDDLAHTMRDAPGVGLAAPQLGEAMQACVIEVESQLYELVNPKIVRASGEDRDLEGCLSIPGYVAYVTRNERVWVVAQNRHGQKIKVAGSGLLGRALQHELDHLDGKLYIDYLDSMDELMAVGVGDEDDAEIREATSALA